MRIQISIWALCVFCLSVFANEPYDPTKWEDVIQKFEEQDKERVIKQVDVLFIGSSSIRKWNLDNWFPNLDALNRGFGGSHIEDSNYYFDRIVTPYKPKVIVLYAGDNDISYGKSPSRVHSDFRYFVEQMKDRLPHTKLIFVAIKPSIKRWALVNKMRKANGLILEDCLNDPTLDFFNIDSPMIGRDGKPDKEFFDDDDLHLNEAGYELWSTMLHPKIERMLKTR